MNFFLIASYLRIYVIIRECESGTIEFNQSIEQSLYNNLTKDYNKAIRPSTVVSVKLQLDLKQIILLDERHQVLTTLNYVSHSSVDSRLSWNPTDFNSLTQISVPVKTIWIPDLLILNSADSD